MFEAKGFSSSWTIWNRKVGSLCDGPNAKDILNLGEHLKEIFTEAGQPSGNVQSDSSQSGANWEALVCWYLNLCLIGRRTVVIKAHKNLIPNCVSDAVTVMYNNSPSNTESDLIAITVPDKEDYTIPVKELKVNDDECRPIPYSVNGKVNLMPLLNSLCERDFNNLEIDIIQCKTNWNDNSQIPMLWDAVYAADSFSRDLTIGRNGYSIKNIKNFSYSFVTVPTVPLERLKPTSTAVLRVRNLSGGNYWGLPSKDGIAMGLQEVFNKNFTSGASENHLTTIRKNIAKLYDEYDYFKLFSEEEKDKESVILK